LHGIGAGTRTATEAAVCARKRRTARKTKVGHAPQMVQKKRGRVKENDRTAYFFIEKIKPSG
jgi:hypothetical protein